MSIEKETAKNTFADFEKIDFNPIAVGFSEFEELPPPIYEKLDDLDELGFAITQASVTKYLRLDYGVGRSFYIFPESDDSPRVYIVDVESDEVTGYLAIELDAEGNPQVRNTETFLIDGKGQKQGRGIRRLWVARKIAPRLYGKVLHSGSHIHPAPERMWEELQRQGFAELIGTNNDGERRWRMTPDKI